MNPSKGSEDRYFDIAEPLKSLIWAKKLSYK